jgi:hypothetical protein
MSLIRKTVAPPQCEKGDIFKANIRDITKEVSPWKNQDGSLKEQLQIQMELENGYRTYAWITYYDEPREESTFGKLTLTLVSVTKRDITTASDAIENLKRYGRIFVRVKGFREYKGTKYPKFEIITDKLPALHQDMNLLEEVEITPDNTGLFNQKTNRLMNQFKDVIKFGLPLNANDWTKNLLV